jgi:hypothetical protein
MEEEVTAISGTRRKVQELVDGTLRVLVDIDPRFKADFHRLFPNIDTPIALAPLETEFEKWDQETRLYPDKPRGGPLCKLAGIWSKDEHFQLWLSGKHGGELFTEASAAQWIRDVCDVESRSEIDGNDQAELNFHNRIRIPFGNWMKGNR